MSQRFLAFIVIAPLNTVLEIVIARQRLQAVPRSAAGGFENVLPISVAAEPVPASFNEGLNQIDAVLQRSLLAQIEGGGQTARDLNCGIDSALLPVGFDEYPHDEALVQKGQQLSQAGQGAAARLHADVHPAAETGHTTCRNGQFPGDPLRWQRAFWQQSKGASSLDRMRFFDWRNMLAKPTQRPKGFEAASPNVIGDGFHSLIRRNWLIR
ncbi:MAG: hypothetical protein KA760_07945 [Steroidobacteraceae bacterium]|nr:hypothetical protein [Steroidobacteraceae bacterium]